MRRIAFVPAVAAVLLAGAAFGDTMDFDFKDFARVKADTGLTVEITEGEGFAVTAEGSARALKRLDIDRVGDTLVLTQRPRGLDRFSPLLWMTADEVEVSVTLPALKGVAASSGATVAAQGATADRFDAEASSGALLSVEGIAATRVELEASSGAELRLDGQCDAVDFAASSGAWIHADELACAAAEAEASSGAGIRLTATTVRAEASSGGQIEVWGAEEIEADTSSGGTVRRHD